MKKLLLALTAAASCALVAKADDPSPILNQTGFENYVGVFDPAKDDVGGDTPSYWTWTGSTPTECAITNYAANTQYNYTNHGAPLVENGPGNSYLSVDASDGQLMRNVAASANPVAIDSGIYFDSLIEFTATDTAPAISNADKLVVWLYGSDETDGTLFGATTGLVVTAGLVDGTATTATNYFIEGVSIEPGSWHRLTIGAIANITKAGELDDDSKIGGFVVYVDGNVVSNLASKGDFAAFDIEEQGTGLTDDAAALNTVGQLFPSLVKAGAAATNLTSVAFAGTGAIDDLTFTTVNPFEVAVETFGLTVTVSGATTGADLASLKWKTGDGEYQTFKSGTQFDVIMPAASVVVSVPLMEGYSLTAPTGVTVSHDEGTEDPESGDTIFIWTATINTSAYEADGAYSIALTVTDGDTPATYVLTLTQGTGTTLSAMVGGSVVNTGAQVDENAEVTIAAAISNDEQYENLVVIVGGVDVTSQLVNGSYSFTMTAATTVATSATEKQAPQPADWPEDPSTNTGKTASEAYGVTGDLANADAGALATWAKANSVAYNGTILTDAFLLNCANTQEAINAAKADFKVTSISVAADGTVTIAPADGAKYGNGKVEVLSAAALASPMVWREKTAGDQFFTVQLVVDPVPQN